MVPPPDPLCLVAELTHRCPLRCPYCSNPLHLTSASDELSTQEWTRVLREAAMLGVVQVHFSGGEPTARKDLVELVRTSRACGLYTHVITAGIWREPELLENLVAAGLDALQISLQDADPLHNDQVAGTPCFERKQQTIADARRLGLAVTLNVVLHRRNLDRIAAIIDLARRWEVPRVELAHVQYTGWALRNRASLLPTREQLARAQAEVEQARRASAGGPEWVHVLPDYYQEWPKPCVQGWGRVFLTVAPDGRVLPCPAASDIAGLEFPSVRGDSLESIWRESPAFRRFRGEAWMPEPCRSCDRRAVDFGGCRCQAYLLTGDLHATDPVCRLSPHHRVIVEAVREANDTPDAVAWKYRQFPSAPR